MTLKEIKHRINTKPGYPIVFFGLLLGFGFYLLHLDNQSYLNNIKNNPNIDVQCVIKGEGLVSIDKSKIVDVMDDGTFVFTNGYAKNCEVISN